MSEPIHLDADAVTARTIARYQRMVTDLVAEIAQLEAYIATVNQPASEPSAATDAWGNSDPAPTNEGKI